MLTLESRLLHSRPTKSGKYYFNKVPHYDSGENIKNIFILKPEYLFGNKYLFTEYLFEKKKKPERKGGKRAKVYTVAICTVLFVAFFVTCAKKKS